MINSYAQLNLKAEARKTYLSYLWWIIEPILYVTIFYLVFDIILQSDKANYLIFLMCGKIPFLWISKSITNSTGSIIKNKGLLSQTAIQSAVFPLVTLQESLYKQLPVFIMLIGFVIVSGIEPSWSWVWLPIVIVLNYILIIPAALLGALITSFIPDFRIAISLFMMFLLY